MTITEFLLARIMEDEQEAREAIAWRDRIQFDHPPAVPDMSLQAWPDSGVPAVLVGPERVLAECEAKRRIADEHSPSPCVITSDDDEDRDSTYCVLCLEMDGIDQVTPACPTLRALAAIYASHPDCRQEWGA